MTVPFWNKHGLSSCPNIPKLAWTAHPIAVVMPPLPVPASRASWTTRPTNIRCPVWAPPSLPNPANHRSWAIGIRTTSCPHYRAKRQPRATTTWWIRRRRPSKRATAPHNPVPEIIQYQRETLGRRSDGLCSHHLRSCQIKYDNFTLKTIDFYIWKPIVSC